MGIDHTYLLVEKTDTKSDNFSTIEAKTVFSLNPRDEATSSIRMESDLDVSIESGMKMTLKKITNYESPIVVSFGDDNSDKAVKLDVHYV